MIRIAMISAALAAGLATQASAKNALQLGVQGRPHAGDTAEKMLLFRNHMTRAQYNRMRMQHRRMHVR